MSKRTGIILGIVLIVVGLALAIIGIIMFFSAATTMEYPQGSFTRAGLGAIMIFVGVVLAGSGGFVLYFTNIGKIFSYMANETAPGVETATHAAGKGIASGVKTGLTQPIKGKKQLTKKK